MTTALGTWIVPRNVAVGSRSTTEIVTLSMGWWFVWSIALLSIVAEVAIESLCASQEVNVRALSPWFVTDVQALAAMGAWS